MAARGQPGPAERDASPDRQAEPVILLMWDFAQPDSRSFADAIGSHLAGLPIRVVQADVPRTKLSAWLARGSQRAHEVDALGSFVIDVQSGQVSRLFLIEANGEPTLIRQLPAGKQMERVVLEEAGITVALLVEALLDGRHIGMLEPVPRDDFPLGLEVGSIARSEAAPRPRVLQRNSPESSERIVPTLALGLTGTSWLVDERWQLGVALGVGLQFGSHWASRLRYTWFPELTHALEGTDVSLARHPLRAEMAYRLSAGLSPSARLGAWFDAVSRRTVVTAPAYSPTSATTTWSWGFVGWAGVATPIRSSLRAHFEVGVEVPTRRLEYVLQSETRRSALATRSIRPVVDVGLEIAF